MQKSVFLVISTGRTGTQWLADRLSSVYPDLISAFHEPNRDSYVAKRFLRKSDQYKHSEYWNTIEEHFREIDRITESRIYVETGWPIYSAIPLFMTRFGSRLRLIHLVRSPIETAASLTTHRYYSADRVKDFVGLNALEPADSGILWADYAVRWPHLATFEKCLFHWGEIHMYGLELESLMPAERFLRIRFEDMFGDDGETLRQLALFLEIPLRNALIEGTGRHVDRHARQTPEAFEWNRLFAHERVIALAARLGYNFDDVDEKSLRRRYQTTLVRKALRRLADAPRRYRKRWKGLFGH